MADGGEEKGQVLLYRDSPSPTTKNGRKGRDDDNNNPILGKGRMEEEGKKGEPKERMAQNGAAIHNVGISLGFVDKGGN